MEMKLNVTESERLARTVLIGNGSFTIIIPIEVVRKMKLKKSDYMKIFFDEKAGIIVYKKVDLSKI